MEIGSGRRSCLSTEEENMAWSRRLMEARVKGDLDAVDKMLTPDFVTHTKLVPGQQPGREGEKWAITQLTAAFSTRRVVVEDQVAAGDKVVTRFVVHVTHDRGELMGVAPSGKVMTNKIIMIHRMEGGQDSRGVEHRNARLKTEGTASRARDTRARASRARATGGEVHPASLAP